MANEFEASAWLEWKDLVTPLISAGLAIVVACIGWLVLNIFIKPIQQFLELRREIREALFDSENVVGRFGNNSDRFNDCQTELRRLAARLEAYSVTRNYLPRCCLRLLGFDLKAGAIALTGLSNNLGEVVRPSVRGARAGNKWDVERALKFPLSYSTRPGLRDNAL